MVVGFTTTYSIGAYHYWCCGFDFRSGRGVQHCDKVCQWPAAGRWFSLSPPVFSTNKTDRHDIIEVLSKVALNTINLNLVNILVNSSRIQESKRSSMCIIWRGVDVASFSWIFLLEFGTDSTALYMVCFSFHHHYKMIFLSAYYHQLLTLVQST